MAKKIERTPIPTDHPMIWDDIKAIPDWDWEAREAMILIHGRQNRTEADRERGRKIARRAYQRLEQKARDRAAREKAGK